MDDGRLESEGQLARALLDGDAQAPSAAWNRYAPIVRSIVRQGLGFVMSFAFRIVRSERRRRRARRWLVFTETGQIAEDQVPSTATESWAELRERTVMLLRHLEGLTFAEIARFLEVSLATAKRLLKRASQSLVALDHAPMRAVRAGWHQNRRLSNT